MNSRKHGYPYPGQPPAQGGGAERPMFANDHHDDYPGQGGAAAAEPDFDSQGAAQQWVTPEAGQEAVSDADQQALAAEIEALRAELAEAQARATDNYEQFVRASAEIENVRRRGKEDVAKAQKFAIEGFAESLLPVCDSLEMALKVDAPSVDSIRQGVEATLRQLQQALERNKVQVVDPVGQRFDPNSQQAISMQPSAEVPANHVVSVLQKGYLINERVLRPAMVVVSQGG